MSLSNNDPLRAAPVGLGLNSIDPIPPLTSLDQVHDDAELFEDADGARMPRTTPLMDTSSSTSALDSIIEDAPFEEDEKVQDLSDEGEIFDLPNSSQKNAHHAESQRNNNQESTLPTLTHVQAPMTALSKVPVTISLELGTLSCNLQKLIDLRENDVLQLEQPVGQVIDLKIEGRLIGKGEIVRIGDQLGLRISELADR
jgi:flagellar motor switch protein FliN